jgi:hypothetical protein
MRHFARMFGWFKKSRQSAPEIFGAVARLGDLMEHYPLHVLDVSLLPMPKPQMKVALKEIWHTAAPAQRQALEVGYMSLANFQSGVGSKPISLALSGDSPSSKAMSRLDATIAWMKRTSEERMALFEEFVTFKQAVK